ncbi:AMP-binding protein [Alcaligenaceae bacterium]|nr:AMP-binding protein [Alcaligenaceae bacterium]
MQGDINPLYSGTTVAQLYLSAFKAFPDRKAIVCDGTVLTYAMLHKRCNQIARLLKSKGLKKQDAVALLLGNRADAIATLVAVQFIGLRSVSLHPMASEEDHIFVLEDSQAKALIVDSSRFLERAVAINKKGVSAKIFTLDDSSIDAGLLQQAALMDDSDFVPESDPDEVTKIAYTGGTTGKSKGVLQPHRTAVTMMNYQLATFEWPADIRLLAATPISHAAGALILPAFIRGGTVYLMEKYTVDEFLDIVQTHRINCTFLVPTQIYGLLDQNDLGKHDLSSLELILYGAAPIAPPRLKEALEKIGPVFAQLYGQAEAPMTICYLSKGDHDLNRPHLLASCGRVITGNQVKLLDEHLQEVATGELGELCVRGPLVTNGYFNRPEENDKAFAGSWLHTGDMAKQDADGYLYILDRSKDMIISGGFNVYPSEIENCLAQHPDISMSAVIGLPHQKWGEEVTAVVVKKAGKHPTEQELIDYVTQHKGALNAPKSIIFEDELPLTGLGKINKKAIRSKYWQGQDRQVS